MAPAFALGLVLLALPPRVLLEARPEHPLLAPLQEEFLTSGIAFTLGASASNAPVPPKGTVRLSLFEAHVVLESSEVYQELDFDPAYLGEFALKLTELVEVVGSVRPQYQAAPARPAMPETRTQHPRLSAPRSPAEVVWSLELHSGGHFQPRMRSNSALSLNATRSIGRGLVFARAGSTVFPRQPHPSLEGELERRHVLLGYGSPEILPSFRLYVGAGGRRVESPVDSALGLLTALGARYQIPLGGDWYLPLQAEAKGDWPRVQAGGGTIPIAGGIGLSLWAGVGYRSSGRE